MISSLSSAAIESFLGRVVDASPDGASSAATPPESIARKWIELGLRPGDVVLLALPNGRALLSHWFGVLTADGVPALVPPNLPVARLREIVQQLGARAIGAFRLPGTRWKGDTRDTVGSLQVAILPPLAPPSASPGEVVLLTSGTSGFASGCVFDIEALLLNARRHAASIGQLGNDTLLVSLPLHFSFALVAQALASFVLGNRLVISGPPFGVSAYQKLLRDHGVTVSSVTPVLVPSLLRSGGSFLGELRVLTVGGDSLEPGLVAPLLECRKSRELYLTYGLTQAGPRVLTLAAHSELAHRYASAGLPLERTTVHLRPAGAGHPQGLKQLYVTSETVMKRSVGLVEGRANHGLLAPRTIATGDAFVQDDAGYLYFKGRLSDYINRRGEKISLVAVRRLASQLPHVVSVKTRIIRESAGDEDFELELRLSGEAASVQDPRKLLRRVLRSTEMPRQVRVMAADETSVEAYK